LVLDTAVVAVVALVAAFADRMPRTLGDAVAITFVVILRPVGLDARDHGRHRHLGDLRMLRAL
jgi:hypothetical protein